MARQAPSIFGFTGKSNNVQAPDFFNLKSAGVGTSAGSAANTVSVGSIYGGLRDNAPDHQVIVEKMARMRAQEKIASQSASAFMEKACETLRQLKPVTFYYKEEYSQNPERMHYGFIAQEYQKVMPDATYTDPTTGKLCIDPIELIGLLVRANQELEKRVTQMEVKQVLATV